VHKVFAGSHKQLYCGFQLKMRQAIGANETTIGSATREARVLPTQHDTAYGGVDAIGAH